MNIMLPSDQLPGSTDDWFKLGALSGSSPVTAQR